MRQLLRHEAGLADYGELADYYAAVAQHAAPWPAEEMLQRLDEVGELNLLPEPAQQKGDPDRLPHARPLTAPRLPHDRHSACH